MLFLVYLPKGNVTSFSLADGEDVLLGRDPDRCDISVMEPSLSRVHCKFTGTGSRAWLEDLGSTNGTFVNDERVDIALVQSGDTIRLGECRVDVAIAGTEGRQAETVRLGPAGAHDRTVVSWSGQAGDQVAEQEADDEQREGDSRPGAASPKPRFPFLRHHRPGF